VRRSTAAILPLAALAAGACAQAPPPPPPAPQQAQGPVVQVAVDPPRPPAPPEAGPEPPPEAAPPKHDSSSPGEGESILGKPGPQITGDLLRAGGTPSGAGGKVKVLVVHFWATFCAPCQRTFPAIRRVADRHRGEVLVLAIAEDDPDNAKPADLLAFVKKHQADFGVMWDRDHAMATRWGLRTMPSTFVLDRQSVVRHVHEGFRDGDPAILAAEVDALLQ
jgi:thiol-disulfide isomerase/thioredoxin